MAEESQVRGCYNRTFVCTPTRKQCLCWKRHKQRKHLEHESKLKYKQQQLSNKYSNHVVYLWVTIIRDKMTNDQAHKLCALKTRISQYRGEYTRDDQSIN